jgi:hypothetical protein
MTIDGLLMLLLTVAGLVALNLYLAALVLLRERHARKHQGAKKGR